MSFLILYFLLITIFLLYISSYGFSINTDLLSFDTILIYGVRDTFNVSSVSGIKEHISLKISLV